MEKFIVRHTSALEGLSVIVPDPIQQNKPGKIIILYDEDERIAPNAATTFVQRGIDNIFMLSGGEISLINI